MKPNKEIVYANSLNDLPSIEKINSLSRDVILIVLFNKNIENKREKIARKWKRDFPDFLIRTGSQFSQKNHFFIQKLITDDEITKNQDFFEQCAKDYKNLATELIFGLADHLNLKIDSETPLKTFSDFIYKDGGNFNDWRYDFHGHHCHFINIISQQSIEISLVCGLDFGELDPLFFTEYILSNPKYIPLPIEIYGHYYDGIRILRKMAELGILKLHNRSNNNYVLSESNLNGIIYQSNILESFLTKIGLKQ